MLKSLTLSHFTVFEQATFEFGQHLNVIIGENGTGKSHLLKLLYSILAARAAPHASSGRELLESRLHEKLRSVFRADQIGNLIHAHGPQAAAAVRAIMYEGATLAFDLEWKPPKPGDLRVSSWPDPSSAEKKLPVFLPPKELLSIYPGFSSLYSTTEIPFEETWNDTCLLLGKRLPKTAQSKLVKSLEQLLGGSVLLENDHFYLQTTSDKFEMHLVAEGLRKLAMIARLRANRSLRKGVVLFWDEPESNLNPRLITEVARVILRLGKMGVQVFITTHSLFLMRELYILQQTTFKDLDSHYIGLRIEDEDEDRRVRVSQGPTLDDVGAITALDEELRQADAYLDAEAKAALADDDESEQE